MGLKGPGRPTPHSHPLCTGPFILVAAPAQLRQVGQLLDADDAVIEGGLQALGNSVSQDDGDHDRQNVGDLARELKDNHSRGHCVCHCPCKCSRP